MSADWWEDTRHLRDWVNGGGTPTEPLREELAASLVTHCDSIEQAMRYLLAASEATDTEKAS